MRPISAPCRICCPVRRLPHAQVVSADVVPRPLRSDTVVAVGRLTYQKAPDTVLDMPRRLGRTGQAVRCVWVGDGDARTRAELEANGWQVTGWVDSSEVGRLLRCAVVLLHPARYEGFSLAIVEDAVPRDPRGRTTDPGERGVRRRTPLHEHGRRGRSPAPAAHRADAGSR